MTTINNTLVRLKPGVVYRVNTSRQVAVGIAPYPGLEGGRLLVASSPNTLNEGHEIPSRSPEGGELVGDGITLTGAVYLMLESPGGEQTVQLIYTALPAGADD